MAEKEIRIRVAVEEVRLLLGSVEEGTTSAVGLPEDVGDGDQSSSTTTRNIHGADASSQPTDS